MTPPEVPPTQLYRSAIRFALKWQLGLWLFITWISDGGRDPFWVRRLWYITVSIIAFWSSVGVAFMRKGRSPSQLDIQWVMFGIFVTFLLSIIAVELVETYNYGDPWIRPVWKKLKRWYWRL